MNKIDVTDVHYFIGKQYTNNTKLMQSTPLQKTDIKCIDIPPVYLYKILVLFNCFLDGWCVEIYNGRVKLSINKSKLIQPDYTYEKAFDIDGFIEHNSLY